MLLEVNNLTVNYGKARALESVCLKVDDGELVCMIGANGAGKTTLLRAISGLVKPVSGEIRFQGRRIDGLQPHDTVKIGIAQIPAGRMIFPSMTVLDNLKTGASLRKDKKGVAYDLEVMYRHFPILEERRSQLGAQLSGGEQQMLAIARALMADPKLLLIDEPSVGLSPLIVAEVNNIMKDIHRKGLSILLVEQNSRMALKLAQRAYTLELGKVALEGNAQALLNDERVRKYYLGGD